MNLRFYGNMISQASKNIAGGIFVGGLFLIGIGFLIYVLRDIFAILFAILFCAAGVGCIITAAKILWTQWKINRFTRDNSQSHRKNVQIHTEFWEN